MHPEIRRDKPGRCPKCGMRLINATELDKAQNETSGPVKNSYKPLVVIIGLIIIVSLVTSLRNPPISINNFIYNFMAGFFIVFSGFKLIDLKGFAEGYSTYDLLARKWYGYGYIYPLMELFFGLSMIIGFQTHNILLAEIFIMTFSGLGVALKLLKHEKFQCACLGTFLKVPLTRVTLIEDFGMSLLALLMLVLR